MALNNGRDAAPGVESGSLVLDNEHDDGEQTHKQPSVRPDSEREAIAAANTAAELKAAANKPWYKSVTECLSQCWATLYCCKPSHHDLSKMVPPAAHADDTAELAAGVSGVGGPGPGQDPR